MTQSGVAVGGALGPLGFGGMADAVSLTASWSVTGLLAAGAVLAGRRLLCATGRPCSRRCRHRPRHVDAGDAPLRPDGGYVPGHRDAEETR